MAYGGGDPSQSPQIAALMQQLSQTPPDQGQGAPPPDASGGGGGGGGDPLSAVQQCIQDIHGLAAIVKDPNDTQAVVQALGILTKVQSNMMATQKGAQYQ